MTLSINRETATRRAFPSYAELSPATQTRLSRLSRRKAGLVTLRLTPGECEEIARVEIDRQAHFHVPAQGYDHGRQVAYDLDRRMLWTLN